METAWHKGPLCAFDLETTDRNEMEARVVTASIVHIDTRTGATTKREWLIDPGCTIPEEAANIHGITTEKARADGRPPRECLDEINEELRAAQAKGTPIVGFNLAYDMSALKAESDRHGSQMNPGDFTRVVDAFVLDRMVDTFRKGRKTLTAVCETYGAKHDGPHQSTADSVAAARVSYIIAERYPQQVQIPLEELHANQQQWKAKDSLRFQNYKRNQDGDDSITISPHWPVRLASDDPDASNHPANIVAAPAPRAQKRPPVEIPPGRYALRGDDGKVGFYVVDKPADGKWRGYTFVKRQIGDTTEGVRGSQRDAILQVIGQDPKGAAVLYGKELGICSICGHTLTNPESRAAGIGPKCAARF